MLETHFGLRQRPFRSLADAACYYPATGLEQALEPPVAGLAEDEALALITGGPGSGKSLLCLALLGRLDEQVASAFLTNSHFAGRAGLLQAILYDLGQPFEGKSEQELRLALTDYLLQSYADGKRTLIVVDEAQHLTPDLLEELRLLGNLEAHEGRAVQVVLAGQLDFLETLQRPELASFRQRLAVRVQLEPLPATEAADYVVWHLRSAGGDLEQIVTSEALELLVQGAGGIPRVLNQAASRALQLACSAGAEQVDAESVLDALTALGLEVPDSPDDGNLIASPTTENPWEPVRTDDALPALVPVDGEPGPSGRKHRLYEPPRRHA